MTNTIDYKGYKIEVWQDDFAENPFTSWDGNLPLMKVNDGYFEDYSKGDIQDYLANVLSDNQILRHQKAIAEAFEIDLDYFIENEFTKEDKISDIQYAIKDSIDFDALEVICKLSKTSYLNTSSRGYSQGDHAYIFTCYTEKFQEVNGSKKKDIDEAYMRDTVNLWGYWAWGDVYGFTIEGIDDSCGGFYGDDNEKSGLLGYAKESIDSHIKRKRKERFNKLKTLIKNKVDIFFRPEILAHY